MINNANTVWFDGIQLYKEQFGASYTYDASGNITKLQRPVAPLAGEGLCALPAVGAAICRPLGILMLRHPEPPKTRDGLRLSTGLTQSWTYDLSGNITKRTEGSEEISYTYETTGWKDLLKSYNGMSITYDGVGNPEDDGTWQYQWVHGRQLKKMTHKTTGETWNFTYNADGLRTKRTHTANGTTTVWEYVYNGSQLTQMKKGSDTLHFTYDASGTPMTVTHNGTVYYYVTNLQGDIVKLIDTTGTTVATYSYDAWGNPTNTPTGTVATLNPLRYRGYVYDPETELYYLQSRYYNPEIGRFINADIFVSTGQGILGNNMFVYCDNNPVVRMDSSGAFWNVVIGAVVGASISLVSSIVSEAIEGDFTWKDVGQIAISTTIGAAEGALIALCPAASIPISAAASAADTAINGIIDGGTWSVTKDGNTVFWN